MSDTLLVIAAEHCRPACRDEPDLLERIRKAMRGAQDFWMSTDEDLRFRGAVGAALLETSDPDERDRLERSIGLLRNFSALLNGVPVGFDKAFGDAAEDAIPLMKMWHEEKEKAP